MVTILKFEDTAGYSRHDRESIKGLAVGGTKVICESEGGILVYENAGDDSRTGDGSDLYCTWDNDYLLVGSSLVSIVSGISAMRYFHVEIISPENQIPSELIEGLRQGKPQREPQQQTYQSIKHAEPKREVSPENWWFFAKRREYISRLCEEAGATKIFNGPMGIGSWEHALYFLDGATIGNFANGNEGTAAIHYQEPNKPGKLIRAITELYGNEGKLESITTPKR